MHILLVHNEYQNSPGGEEVLLEKERSLLVRNGHKVSQYIVSNKELTKNQIRLNNGINSIWSPEAYSAISKIIARSKPDIVHVHNTFAILSPSIYWAIKKNNLPAILTLHNYRITCSTSLLFRAGQPCEECIGRASFPALRHRCRYNGSLWAGNAIAASNIFHRAISTYQTKVDAFIAMTEFQARIMGRAGIPIEKIFIKPNFAEARPRDEIIEKRESTIIYIGQIHWMKGIDLIISAWLNLDQKSGRLVVIGDGPDLERLSFQTQGRTDIMWLGKISHEEVMNWLGRCKFLVMASRWYECFPNTLVEAFSMGTPIIVPRLGVFTEIAQENKNGLIFDINNPKSLSEAFEYALNLSENEWGRYSNTALEEILQRYSSSRNYELLTGIYHRVLEKSRLLEN